MPTWTWVLLVVGTVASLWWPIGSGEPAAWAIFFNLASMDISVSSWTARRRQRRRLKQGSSRER